MRVTNTMMINNTLWNINNAANRMSVAEEQEASEKKISLPSDDPVVATRAIKYRNMVDTIAQYQTNVSNVQSWQQQTDTALQDLNSVITSIREEVSKASSGTATDSDKQDIAEDISELRSQAISIMNTSYGGRYVFGGYSTGTAPYAAVDTSATTPAYQIGTVTTFKGDYLNLVVGSQVTAASILNYANSNQQYATTSAQPINYDIGYGSSMTVNTEGQTVVGEGSANLFSTIDKILLTLNGDTAYQTVAYSGSVAAVTTQALGSIDSYLSELDTDAARVSTADADLGARMSTVNQVADRLDTDYTNYSGLMSDNEDMDIAKATMESNSAEAGYDAALSVGAKVISKSLVDYMV